MVIYEPRHIPTLEEFESRRGTLICNRGHGVFVPESTPDKVARYLGTGVIAGGIAIATGILVAKLLE